MSRRQLPNRRGHETREFLFHGLKYSPGAGYFRDGTLAEIFLSSRRPGSEVEAIACDGAILASLALQHGVDISTLRHAMTRGDDGTPATAVGQALDLLDVVDMEPTP